MSEPERVMVPRTGAHLSIWGSGHWCYSDGPHDGPCVCSCGVIDPFDHVAVPVPDAWQASRER